MTRSLILLLGASLALTACDNGETDPTDVTDSTDNTDETDEPEPRLVSVTGSTSELLTQVAAPEGLCAVAVEPTEALGGGSLTVLGSSTVDASGNFTISDVDLDEAPLAIFVVLKDCDDSNTVSFPTGTGIAAEDYEDNVAGDTLNRDSIWIAKASADGINQSLTAVGSSKSMADGMVFAQVLTSAGAPAVGATVSCQGDGCNDLEAYYMDADPSDGLFSTGGSINAGIVVGLAAVPGGPVANYTANLDGSTFSSSLFGSITGLASFTRTQAA